MCLIMSYKLEGVWRYYRENEMIMSDYFFIYYVMILKYYLVF